MIMLERGKIYLMNDAYWLCVNDDPHDIQWEKVQDRKPIISTQDYTIIAETVEKTHE